MFSTNSEQLFDNLVLPVQPVYDGMPKLLVFGGNGFVGSRVCEEAVKTGLQIVSINRSGRPKQSAPWIDEVDWVQASGTDSFTPREQHDVSCDMLAYQPRTINCHRSDAYHRISQPSKRQH